MKILKKRRFIFIGSIVILLGFIGAFIYNKQRGILIISEKQEDMFIGKVLEEINETTVLVEIAEHRNSPYKEKEQVIIQYERGSVDRSLWEKETGPEQKNMQIGEQYIIAFWEKDVRKQNGKDLILPVHIIHYDDDDTEEKETD